MTVAESVPYEPRGFETVAEAEENATSTVFSCSYLSCRSQSAR